MSEALLFGGESKKPSEKGLFDQPTKSKSSSTGTLFGGDPAKGKPAKSGSSNSLFATNIEESPAAPPPTKAAPAKAALEEEVPAPPKPPKKSKGDPKPPKKPKKLFAIFLSIFAALILLGGGTAAAMWFFWQNSDEGILSQAIDHLLISDHADIIIDGQITAESRDGDETFDATFLLDVLTSGKDTQLGLSLDATVPESRWVSGKTYYTCGSRKYQTSAAARADCGWDYDYDFEAGHYEYNSTDYELSTEFIQKDGTYYLKANFSDLASLLEGLGLESLEDYDDEWVSISQDFIEDTLSSYGGDYDMSELNTCIADLTTRYPRADREIYDLATHKDTGIMTITPDSTKGDLTTYSLSLSTDLDRYIDFIESIYDLPFIGEIIDCSIETVASSLSDLDDLGLGGLSASFLNRQTIDNMFSQFIRQLRRLDKDDYAEMLEDSIPEMSLTINRSTRQVEKLSISMDDDEVELSADLNLKVGTRGNTAIEAPSRAKDLENLL